MKVKRINLGQCDCCGASTVEGLALIVFGPELGDPTPVVLCRACVSLRLLDEVIAASERAEAREARVARSAS